MTRTGEEIYRNFRDGAGTGGLADAAAIIKAVADDSDDEVDAIRQLTTRMEAAWQGDAAGAARRGAAPLGTEHESSATGLRSVESAATAEVDQFESARRSVVPVPPKPTAPTQWAGFADLAGQYGRYEDQLDDYNAAAKRNVEVMDDYAAGLGTVAQQLPAQYGILIGGPADVAVRPADTIDVDESDDENGRKPVSATEWRPPSGDSAPGAVTPSADLSQADAQSSPSGVSTSPGSYQPNPVLPGADLGTTQRPTTTPPGLGVGGVGVGVGGLPWAGGPGTGGGLGGRGGLIGAAPREGAPPRENGVPREGTLRGTPGGTQAGARSAVVGGGRGGMSANGVPLGAPGRGRDEEDAEHQRPAFLEGDDPEDLFGSEVLTAPPVIGDEDD